MSERELLHAEFEDYGAEVFAALGPVESMPKTQQRLLAKRFKSPTFTSVKSASALALGAAAHVAIDDHAPVIASGISMTRFPFVTDRTLWECSQNVVFIAARSAAVTGDRQAYETMEPHLWKVENGGEPGPHRPVDRWQRIGAGDLLNPVHDGPQANAVVQRDTLAAESDVEILMLCRMWILDNSPAWPRERIDEAIARTAHFQRSLDTLPAGTLVGTGDGGVRKM